MDSNIRVKTESNNTALQTLRKTDAVSKSLFSRIGSIFSAFKKLISSFWPSQTTKKAFPMYVFEKGSTLKLTKEEKLALDDSIVRIKSLPIQASIFNEKSTQQRLGSYRERSDKLLRKHEPYIY